MSNKHVAIMDQGALVEAMAAVFSEKEAMRKMANNAAGASFKIWAEARADALDRAYDALLTAQEMGRNAGALDG